MPTMMKRLFAAIKIVPDEHFLKQYFRIRRALKADAIRWVDPGNLHLTLKFFGETPEERIGDISTVIGPLARKQPAFRMTLSGLGVFGSRYDPRVIWIGLEDKGVTREFGARLLHRLDEAGFPLDRQNFVPHLTVGRIKNIQDNRRFQDHVAAFRDTFFQEVDVQEVILFESMLKPTGAEYIPLATYRLAMESVGSERVAGSHGN